MGKSVSTLIDEVTAHKKEHHNGTVGIPCDVCSE